jgi:hypothetical protein
MTPGIPPRATPAGNPRSALWRWVMLFYVLGVVLDAGWHIHDYLTTGDREIESYEWVTVLQVSLFWPMDLVAQGILALR